MNPVLFGKLPTQGDFIRVGPDAALLDRLDTWLTSAWTDFVLLADPAWEDRYRVAPLWRFVLPLGDDKECVIGLLSPSLDAIGRLFPLVVAARVTAVDRWVAFRRHAEWLSRVENAVIDALDPPGFDPETLLAGVQSALPDAGRGGGMSLSGLHDAGQPGFLYVSLEGWEADRGIGFAAASGWSYWQSIATDGRSNRALHLQGWPRARALGWLMALDVSAPPRPIEAARSKGPPRAAGGGYRLELAQEVLSLAPQSIFRIDQDTVDNRLLACCGGRGIVLLALDAVPLVDPWREHAAIVLHGILGPAPICMTDLESAAAELAEAFASMALIVRADDGWLLCRSGSRLEVGIRAADEPTAGFDRLGHVGDWVSIKWHRSPGSALEVIDTRQAGSTPGSKSGRLGGMLGLGKPSKSNGRRMVLFEPSPF